jgi:hypothetical protein
MTTRRRDLLATGLVITLVVLYLSYQSGGILQDARGMASAALILGGATVLLLLADDEETIGWFDLGVAVIGVVFGVVALMLTGSAAEILLASFVGSVLLLWGIEVAEHITFPPPKQ